MVPPPSCLVPEESWNRAQLWRFGGSLFAKSTVKFFPAATARHDLSKPLTAAPAGAAIWRVVEVPLGWQGGAELVGPTAAVGGARVGSWNARTRPPEDVEATSRFVLVASNHATACFLPSAETAMLGFAPPRLPPTGCPLKVWLEAADPTMISLALVSVH